MGMWYALFSIGIGLRPPPWDMPSPPLRQCNRAMRYIKPGSIRLPDSSTSSPGRRCLIPQRSILTRAIRSTSSRTTLKRWQLYTGPAHCRPSTRRKGQIQSRQHGLPAGLQAMQKPGEATTHLRAAMQYYRDSLDVDPQRQDARYNFELAQRLLQQLQQAQQQQPQPSQSQERPPQQQNPQQHQQRQRVSNTNRTKHRQSSSRSNNKHNSKISRASSPSDNRMPSRPPRSSKQIRRLQRRSPQGLMRHGRLRQEMRQADAERLLDTIRERAQAAAHLRQQWRRSQGQGTRVDKDW